MPCLTLGTGLLDFTAPRPHTVCRPFAMMLSEPFFVCVKKDDTIVCLLTWFHLLGNSCSAALLGINRSIGQLLYTSFGCFRSWKVHPEKTKKEKTWHGP